MQHQEQISTGDKLLLIGHVTAALSTLLITIGSILKAGRLPGVGIGVTQPVQAQPAQTTTKGYFDL